MNYERLYITPVLDEGFVAARVETRVEKKADGKNNTVLTIKLPEGYRYPRMPEDPPELPDNLDAHLPEAGLVTRKLFENAKKTMQEIIDAKLPFKGEKSDSMTVFIYPTKERDEWFFDGESSFPPAILKVITTAFAHEASINPRFKHISRVDVDIRLQTASTINKEEIPDAHTDYEGSDMDGIYFISLPKFTTEQYTGTLKQDMRDRTSRKDGREPQISIKRGADWWKDKRVQQHIAWSSLLPGALYRATVGWVHSMPEGLTSKDASSKEPRFFMRVAFVHEN
jgi:hypothetical protein